MAVGINSGYLTGLLLESKADISIRDERGRTALAYAKEKGSDEAMRALQQQSQGIGKHSREEEGPKSQDKKRGRDEEAEEVKQPQGAKRFRDKDDDNWKSRRKNKHSAQVWANEDGCDPRYDIPFCRTLQADEPSSPSNATGTRDA